MRSAKRRGGTSLIIAGGLALASVTVAAPSAQAAPACTLVGTTVTCVFTYTGTTEEWIVPAGVTEIDALTLGAQGGDVGDEIYTVATGGLGGSAAAPLPVTPGDTLIVTVGGAGGSVGPCNAQSIGGAGGFNGGGTGGGINLACEAAGGGGGTDIRTAGGTLADRILVAGGGGGAAHVEGGTGGSGGGLTGGRGAGPADSSSAAGFGGSQLHGGGLGGTLGFGGPGDSVRDDNGNHFLLSGGGGGGGYYGGGGGYETRAPAAGSGGGGSGFGPADTVFANGVRTGNGEVRISYSAVAVSGSGSSQLTDTSATVSAVVSLNGRSEAPIQLRWGTSASNLTESVNLAPVSGSDPVTVSSPLSGLSPETEYFFQFVVPGDAFAVLDTVESFRTGATPAPPSDDDADDDSTDDDRNTPPGGNSSGGSGTPPSGHQPGDTLAVSGAPDIAPMVTTAALGVLTLGGALLVISRRTPADRE